MNKEGYQPLKTTITTKIIPPNSGSNVHMLKDGYTWKDLDRSYWQGFDTAKNKMEKLVKNLKTELTELKNRDCWKSCEYANPKSEWIGQHIKDVQSLAKAKELLTRFVMASIYLNGKETELVADAEQFLKEE